jgi:hypothetical protein
MIARMLCQQFGPLPSRCASFAQRGRAPSFHYACSFAAGRSATQGASISRAGRRCTHYGSLRTVSSSDDARCIRLFDPKLMSQSFAAAGGDRRAGYAVRSAEKTIRVQKQCGKHAVRELLRHRSRVESPRSICRYYNEYQRKERQRTHNIMRQPSGTRARNLARTCERVFWVPWRAPARRSPA